MLRTFDQTLQLAEQTKALMKMPTEDMKKYNLSSEVQGRLADAQGVWQFLQDAKLGEYTETFVLEGYDTVEVVKEMDESDLQTCGVRPGHIKKFKMKTRSLLDCASDRHPGLFQDGNQSLEAGPCTEPDPRSCVCCTLRLHAVQGFGGPNHRKAFFWGSASS